MTPPDITSEITITRKKFIGSGGAIATGAVVGAVAYLGSEQKAEASGSPAYINVVESFQAGYTQTFQGKAIFQNSNPWIDVMSPTFGVTQGTGLTTAQMTANTTGINNAIAAAVATSGTGAAGNAIVYFPPGIYSINGAGLSPAINSSNFTLLGAGSRSSVLYWGTTTNTPTNLLTLMNCRGVVIRDLGFSGVAQSIGSICAIDVSRNSGWVSTTPPPSEVLVERVCIGDPTQAAGTVIFGYGIAYSAASGQDTYSDNGTFRDVSIFNSMNGYYFSTANGLRHVIEGGSVQNCSAAAVNNNTPSETNGGSYTVIGTRFAGNATTFLIGPTANNETLNIVGAHIGTPTNPETKLINTPAALPDQSVVFTGGHAILNDPGSANSIYFNTQYGTLDFHGFRIYSPTGVSWNFPNAGRVNFYGGLLKSKSVAYACPLQFQGTHEQLQPTFTAANSLYSRLIGFGYQNHLLGGTAQYASGQSVYPSVAGSGASLTVTGSDLGGLITLTTGSSGLSTGNLLLVSTYSFPFPAGTNIRVLLSAGNTYAATAMNWVYGTPASTNPAIYFYVATTTALLPSTKYIWNYVILG